MNKNELFISKALKVHGDRYDYSKAQYINSKTKVTIICKEHGEFWQTPDKHILRKQRCPNCAITLRGESRRSNLKTIRFEGLVQPEEYKLIPLNNKSYAVVDNEDFEELSKYNWRCKKGYADTHKLGLMHRFIMNAPDNMLVDHEDGNPLNNRRSNLRLATMAQNTYNKKPLVGSTSRFLGVCWDKSKNKWVAQIGFNNTNIYLGRFNVEYEADLAYDKKALELFGEFANLNFKN